MQKLMMTWDGLCRVPDEGGRPLRMEEFGRVEAGELSGYGRCPEAQALG